MVWVILWIICGIGSAVIASNKGRSVGGWFLLGVLGSFIALIVIAALPSNEMALDESRIKQGESRPCPFCAELIKAEAIKCRYCGSDVPLEIRSDLGGSEYPYDIIKRNGFYIFGENRFRHLDEAIDYAEAQFGNHK